MTSLPWYQVTLPIAALYACRMLGLFLLIPVFTLFTPTLQHATPTLVGIALGAYGLTQALFQIPLGILSDNVGRKPVIGLGLIMLILGSLLGAFTHSITGMIIARSLQGTGAIGSVLLALLTDLTVTTDRAKAMAAIGTSIGLSFTVAFLVSPMLTMRGGLTSIFYLTAGLGTIGLLLLYLTIPAYPKTTHCFTLASFKKSVTCPILFQLNSGIFIQHACLTSMFYVLPPYLKHLITPPLTTHFYLPVIGGALLIMLPCLIWAEKRKKIPTMLHYAIILFTVTQAIIGLTMSTPILFIGVCLLYFVAFNLLEALLPAQISKAASPDTRGTVMGIYSTYQFLGIFIGGMLAGLLDTAWGTTSIFIMNTLLGILWIILSMLTAYM